MPEASMSPPDAHHVRGRTYKVTVDKYHRPAQLPRDCVASSYYGEVTTDNAHNYEVTYVRMRVKDRLMLLAGGGDYPDDGTFNEVLEDAIDFLVAQKWKWLPPG